MQARNAASVLPEPVGAAIRVVRPARMCRPARFLGLRGRAEAAHKPLGDDRVRPPQGTVNGGRHYRYFRRKSWKAAELFSCFVRSRQHCLIRTGYGVMVTGKFADAF